jgi:hypothetical protein
MLQPTAFLKTGPISTKILVCLDEDEVLKAILPTTSSPHRRALPTFFEALALWHQAPVHVVLSAAEAELWSRLGLVDELFVSVDTVHYSVELRYPERERRRRIAGLGSFTDLRQLVLGGVR